MWPCVRENSACRRFDALSAFCFSCCSAVGFFMLTNKTKSYLAASWWRSEALRMLSDQAHRCFLFCCVADLLWRWQVVSVLWWQNFSSICKEGQVLSQVIHTYPNFYSDFIDDSEAHRGDELDRWDPKYSRICNDIRYSMVSQNYISPLISLIFVYLRFAWFFPTRSKTLYKSNK